ncbi:MAG TPA: hypothetical protein PL005_16100 [Candidatus Hydrogenedentes bacterium]|nr:hypothetical protein [Candidatus Hydrogenedentota bacterium]
MPSPDRLRRQVEKRRRIVRTFPIGFGLLLLQFALTEGVLLATLPLHTNPFYMAECVRADTLDPETLSRMAAMLPVMVQFCMLIVLALYVCIFAAWINERKYLALIDLLDTQIEKRNRSEENLLRRDDRDTQ